MLVNYLEFKIEFRSLSEEKGAGGEAVNFHYPNQLLKS
jgi:hypothetical protein